MKEDELFLLNTVANCIVLLLSIFMLVFNSILAYLLCTQFARRSTELKLTLTLCIIELVIGVHTFVLQVFKFFYGIHFFDTGTIQCYYYGFFIQWSCRLEIITVSVLSLIRYLMVCHGKEKSLRFWVIVLILQCLPMTCIFVYGLYLLDAKPTVSYFNCQAFLTPTSFSAAMIYVIPLSYAIPCWIISYCYFAIGWSANKKLNNMKKMAGVTNDTSLNTIIAKQKRNLICQLLVVFYIYNVNFMLSYVTTIMRIVAGFKRTPILDVMIFTMINITIGFNPLITINFQPEVNNEFLFMLTRFKAKLKSFIHNLFRRR